MFPDSRSTAGGIRSFGRLISIRFHCNKRTNPPSLFFAPMFSVRKDRKILSLAKGFDNLVSGN